MISYFRDERMLKEKIKILFINFQFIINSKNSHKIGIVKEVKKKKALVKIDLFFLKLLFFYYKRIVCFFIC